MARYKYSENTKEVTDIYFDTETHGEFMGMEQSGEMKKVTTARIKEKLVGEIDGRLDTLEGDETVEGSVAKTVKDAVDPVKGTGWTDENLVDHEDRLDTLEGDDTVVGSVAKSIKDNAQEATFTPTVGSGIESMTIEEAVNEVGARSRTYVPTPTGFLWKDSPIEGKIFQTGKFDFGTDLDVETLIPATGTFATYYVSKNSVSPYNGLTLEHAFRSIRQAITTGTADTNIIYVDDGVYSREQGWGALTPTRNIILKAINKGMVTIDEHERNLSWTLADGYTNTYKATRNSVVRIYDSLVLDVDGYYTKLTKMTSIAEVESTQNSWYAYNDIIYVHTSDDRIPASETIRVYLNADVVRVEGDITVYLEGIKVYGGDANVHVVAIAGTPTIITKNCEFGYASGLPSLIAQGAFSYSQNCVAHHSDDDGFNYHLWGSVLTKAIEINCIGYKNGIGGTINNGSTSHDGCSVIRIGCSYYENGGPNCIDVNADTQSWNLGIYAGDSKGTGGESINNDFSIQLDGAEGWFDGCISDGDSTVALYLGSACTANIKNCLFNRAEKILGTKVRYQ